MGGKSGGGEAKQARADEQKRQAEIRKGTKKVNSIFDGQFNDGYFNGVRQNFIDYATPQVEQQYGDAQKELTFSLARSGNLDSSARADKTGQLQRLYDLNKQNVADQALSYEGQARSSVEDARNGLIATLNATGDAQGAANSAIARSSALSKPAAYSPLTQLFDAFTSGLGAQAAAERAYYYGGGAKPRYDTGLFANQKNAMVVNN